MHKTKKANLITMGCSKNLVDSEKLAWQLKQQGYKTEHEATEFNHDIVFINTCGFINDAKDESIEMVLNTAEAKRKGKVSEIVVFGCLVQRYFNDLKKEIPEVDYWMGNYNAEQMMSLLKLNRSQKTDKRLLQGFGHYAYLKISEGCDRNCAFCAIPLIKGKYISRKIDDLYNEALQLAENGVKELLLIAQDLSYYGRDISGKSLLPQLVKKLSEIEKIKWIRLHYLYPDTFPSEILDIMQKNEKVCRYLDIPLQHSSDRVLRNMRRGTSKAQIENILSKARTKVPGLALRTTMMTGHPGESEREFTEMLEFIKKWQFERLGVFTYSEEEGTYGERKFRDIIPEEIKKERADILMEEQQKISEKINRKKTGSVLKLIADRREGGFLIARSEFDSVEVDNEIFIETEKNIEPGTFIKAKIVKATEFELEGILIEILD